MKTDKDSLVVIGAGLSRSGTLSMKTALEMLLNGGCYHGSIPYFEKKEHVPAWLEAINRGALTPEDKATLLPGFKAGLDFPFNHFWKQLLEENPSAKVVLTVRDYKSHYKSLAGLLGKDGHIKLGDEWPVKVFTRFFVYFPWHFVKAEKAWRSPNTGKTMFEAMQAGEETGIQFFKDWEEDVKSNVPADNLLVFNVKEGWDPLCSFLNLPKPDTPFPNVNDTKTMNMNFEVLRLNSWLTIVGIPLILFFLFLIFYIFSSSTSTSLLGILITGPILAFLFRSYADMFLRNYVESARNVKKNA